ncbi:hypothetical protein [Lentimicrobium sp.]|uniref:gliding motility lipoprotein GldB n=1 Tax=Lentimicrobium sp. TaxID=2034841 RepID=UPI002B771EDE|nr:hypothetical protein [Lentimicrobium sp.]HPF65286.1 hypothetical protein [Lentimicrobium sp.]HPR26763.1 hypothetical protein [Lentimicrobium sp.]
MFSRFARLIFPALLLFAACTGENTGRKTVSDDSGSLQSQNADQEFSIRRYEQVLFGPGEADLEKRLRAVASDYAVFLGTGDIGNEEVDQLKLFISDPQNKASYESVMKQYPDLGWLEKELEEAFGIYEKEIPGGRKPLTYSYVSGYDFHLPVKYADSVLIIALDMYLGQDHEMYKKLGIPLYLSRRYTRDHIVPDVMKEVGMLLIPEKSSAYTLLDAMIEQGKTLYFADVTAKNSEDRFKIGFNAAQLDWCVKNERNLWQFIIENELLYKTDSKAMSMFMVDGPFTSSFSQESPARTGAWLGWQIVKAYMKKNNVSLKQLLDNVDSQEILEKSGYKPGKG